MVVEGAKTLPGLGKLPVGWQVVEFGSTLDGGTRNGVYKPKEFHGSGAKMVNMGELFAYPRLKAAEMERVRLSGDEIERFSLRVGDLLFARRSLVAEGAGKCSIVCEVPEPTAFESSIIRARPDPNLADSLYLYYLFSSPYGSYALGSILRHVAVAGITGSDLLKLSIPLPPPSEQRAIAHIIGALDDKIDLNRRMNETLGAMARVIFKSWFVDFDPVRAKMEGRQPFGMDSKTAKLFPNSFQNSGLGKIPKGWSVRNLGDVVGINKRVVSKGFPMTSIEYVEISDVVEGKLLQTSRYDLAQAPGRAKRCVSHGDTIWSCVRPNRKSYLFIHSPIPNLIVSTGFAVLTPNEIGSSYLYEWVTTEGFVDYLSYSADGCAYPAVRPERFAAAEIIVPAPAILSEFEQIGGRMRDKIAENDSESRTLTEVRDALLPKLISGDIRVKDAQKLVEDTE